MDSPVVFANVLATFSRVLEENLGSCDSYGELAREISARIQELDIITKAYVGDRVDCGATQEGGPNDFCEDSIRGDLLGLFGDLDSLIGVSSGSDNA